MLEEWWKEIATGVGVTVVGIWCRKFLATPSRIDRELCDLNKTINSMHEQHTTHFDEMSDFIASASETIARHDERLKALEHHVSR